MKQLAQKAFTHDLSIALVIKPLLHSYYVTEYNVHCTFNKLQLN